MSLLLLGISAVALGPPLFFLAMAIRHFIPLLRGMKHPWWAPLTGPMLFLNDKYVSPGAARHKKPFVCYAAAFVCWAWMLVLVAGVWTQQAP